MKSPWRREQSRDGGVGRRVRLGSGLEQTVLGKGSGSEEEGFFRQGGRPQSGGMSRASLMLERRRRISGGAVVWGLATKQVLPM